MAWDGGVGVAATVIAAAAAPTFAEAEAEAGVDCCAVADMGAAVAPLLQPHAGAAPWGQSGVLGMEGLV